MISVFKIYQEFEAELKPFTPTAGAAGHVSKNCDFASFPVMEECMSVMARKIVSNRKVSKNAFVVYWRHYG
jgi:hypothetical protein